jgi:hypothetical protein
MSIDLKISAASPGHKGTHARLHTPRSRDKDQYGLQSLNAASEIITDGSLAEEGPPCIVSQTSRQARSGVSVTRGKTRLILHRVDNHHVNFLQADIKPPCCFA